MKFLEATRCCFVVGDLKLAGLLIAALMLLSLVACVPVSSIYLLVVYAICTLAWIALVYGIIRKQTSFMIPAFWVAVAGLCVSLICLIVIPFAGIFFFDRIESYVYKHLMKDIETNNLVVFLLILWVFVAILAVCQWHFASVINSLHKSMCKSRAKRLRPVIIMYPNLVRIEST